MDRMFLLLIIGALGVLIAALLALAMT